MYSRRDVVPDRSWFRDLAGMDFWFLAILGVIVVGIAIGVFMRR